MQRAPEFLRQACRLVAGIVVGGACVLTSPIVGLAEPGCEQPANVATSAAPDAATSGAPDVAARARAGRWIQVDPQTGQPVAPTAPIAAMAPNPAFSKSQQGLVEQPDAGGGVMVDLQGRFRTGATATVGADGKAVLDCVAPGAAAREVKP